MIDLAEYQICMNGHDEMIYLYHRAACNRPWLVMGELDTMADLMEAIYDHIAEYHQ